MEEKKIKYKIPIAFLIILLVNLFFYITLFNKNIMLFVDTSRELYIPFAMNNGDVLYKDIFNVYAPLGYQFNAFLTSIFGNSLNIFFSIGFINSTLILWALYLILRFFLKENYFYNALILLFVSMTCIYSVSQTNYTFPYSYSMIYALSSFIWAMVALLYFLKKDKEKFLYIAFLLCGMSICFKYEFMSLLLVLIGILVYKKTKFKTVIFCLLSLISVPILSITDLLIRGATLSDFHNAINYIVLLSKSNSVKILYSYLGFIPSINSIKDLFLNFIKVTLFILTIIAFIKLYSKKKKINTFIFFIIIPIIICLSVLPNFLIGSNAYYFNWIGLFTLILFLVNYKKILKTNKIFFVFYLTTILCSLKCIFNISFNSYGTYFFPLLLVCVLLYMCEINKNESEEKKTDCTMIQIVILTLLTISYGYANYQRMNLIFHSEKTITSKGSFHAEKHQKTTIENIFHYINNETKKEDKILVIPEGAMINYFTNRKSDNKFYYLIPPNIEIFGEESIVKELEEELPDYILIQPMSFFNFNESYFCESFGNKICNLIPQYYEKPLVFGSDFWIAVYKKKK